MARRDGALLTPIVLTLGAETSVNNPFIVSAGGHAEAAWSVRPPLEIGLRASVYYQSGDTPEGPEFSRNALAWMDHSIGVDLSSMLGQASVVLRLLPWSPSLGGGWTGGLGLFVGGGAVYTRDDLEWVRSSGKETLATQYQVHPTTVSGLFAEARRDRIGMRLRFERDVFIEVVSSTTLEMKNYHMVGFDLVWWPAGRGTP